MHELEASVVGQLLLSVMDHEVSEKLGSIMNKTSGNKDFLRGMNEEEIRKAKLLVLKAIEVGCSNFCLKMRARLHG